MKKLSNTQVAISIAIIFSMFMIVISALLMQNLDNSRKWTRTIYQYHSNYSITMSHDLEDYVIVLKDMDSALYVNDHKEYKLAEQELMSIIHDLTDEGDEDVSKWYYMEDGVEVIFDYK